MIGRLGGDEFALLLWNLSETDAKAKAATLEQAIDALPSPFGGQRVHPGASVGVAMLGAHVGCGLRWKRPTPPCTCARRTGRPRGCGGEVRALQPGQIFRHVAELAYQLARRRIRRPWDRRCG